MYGIKAKILIYSILCTISNTNREIFDIVLPQSIWKFIQIYPWKTYERAPIKMLAVIFSGW